MGDGRADHAERYRPSLPQRLCALPKPVCRESDLAEAEGKFFFDNNSWFLPDTEGEYEAGIAYFLNYLEELSDRSANDAQFYARSDNLRLAGGDGDAFGQSSSDWPQCR